ncbi:nuclear transport factor 2 family protein [Actinocorallia aurea]
MSHVLHPSASADVLAAEVAAFYAAQMPLLEERDFTRFAQTFTADCVFGYEGAWQIQGRSALLEGMRANFARYGSSTVRHWFENRRASVSPEGAILVTATCLVSVTSAEGAVSFEPSCTVRDELVREADGVLRTGYRIIRHDLPNPGVYFALQAEGH